MVAGNIDSITLGMPGSALSDMTLADVDLPHVEEMVGDSLNSCCLFKRAAPVPEAPPQSAFNQAKEGEEDPLQDLDPGVITCHAVCHSMVHHMLCCVHNGIITAGCSHS